MLCPCRPPRRRRFYLSVDALHRRLPLTRLSQARDKETGNGGPKTRLKNINIVGETVTWV